MQLPKKVKKVGIFVNDGIEHIKNISEDCNLDFVQLSGDEDVAFISTLRKSLNKKIIKSFRIRNEEDIKKAVQFQKRFPSENFFVLLDSFKDGAYGGTGKTFDWGMAAGIDKKRLFLSGGLNANNVVRAIREVRPFCVDVCSGVEKSPGKKDSNKMKFFIEAAKQQVKE